METMFCPHCGKQVDENQLIDQTTKSKIICASGGFYGMDNGFNSQYLGSFPKEKEITMWDTEAKILTSFCIFLLIGFIIVTINSYCTKDHNIDITKPKPLIEKQYNNLTEQEKQLDDMKTLLWFNLLK
jgi:hypothetical protein